MPAQHPRQASLGRIVILAVLTAFAVGFGSGAVTVWRLGDTGTALAVARQVETAVAPAGLPAARPTMADTWIAALEPPRPASAAPAATRGAAELLPEAAPIPRPRHLPAALGPELGEPAAADGFAPLQPPAAEDAGEPDAVDEPLRSAHQIDVRRGDTLMNILARFGIQRAEAHAAIASLSDVYDPRRLRVGQQLALELEGDEASDGDRQLASLSLNLDFTQDVVIVRDDDGGFAATTVERALTRDTAFGAGSIDDSLYLSGQRAGLPQDVLAEFIRLFSWDVDFQREIQPGDTFETVFERLTTEDGSEIRSGDVLFAALSVGGRGLEAYRFERSDGSVDFFDRDGRSLRKFLLRTPIDGARLSSGFGPRRHPVLGYTRMHRGVDFAAPTGTPIYAAGDGVVDFAGTNGGYGKYIRIHHNGEYATAYAHLNGYAPGISRGTRVRQGQVIGYVGTTGVSTGPHLHYEVMKAGSQINPLSVKSAVADALSGREIERFRRAVAEIDRTRRDHGGGTQLASRMP